MLRFRHTRLCIDATAHTRRTRLDAALAHDPVLCTASTLPAEPRAAGCNRLPAQPVGRDRPVWAAAGYVWACSRTARTRTCSASRGRLAVACPHLVLRAQPRGKIRAGRNRAVAEGEQHKEQDEDAHTGPHLAPARRARDRPMPAVEGRRLAA